MSGIQAWLMAMASFLLSWPWLPLIAGGTTAACAGLVVTIISLRHPSTSAVQSSPPKQRAVQSPTASAFRDEVPAPLAHGPSAVAAPAPLAHGTASGPLRDLAGWRAPAQLVATPDARQVATAVVTAAAEKMVLRTSAELLALDPWRAAVDAPMAAAAVTIETPSAATLAEQEYRRGLRLLVRQSPDREEPLRGALACFRRAQEYWTRDRAPERWAAIQNDIGRVYQELPSGDRAQRLRTAIMHHESALEVFDPANHPTSWAWTQAALGAAYLNTPSGSAIVNARAAVAYYQRALDIFTREATPLAWAWNQNNLGAAFETLRGGAEGERVARLRDAATCYESALLVFTHEAYPTQHHLVSRNLERVQADLHALE